MTAADVIYGAALVGLAVAGLVWMLRTIAQLRVVLFAFMALIVLLWLTGELAG